MRCQKLDNLTIAGKLKEREENTKIKISEQNQQMVLERKCDQSD